MTYDAQNIEDGVYTDMTIETYHENKTHLSSSSIKEGFKSMAHLKAYLDKKEERKSHFDFGNAFELSVTNSELFSKKVAIYDETDRPQPSMNFGSKENKKWKADFYEANESKMILPLSGDDSLDILTILKESLFSHPAAVALLKNSEYQTSIFWTDPESGLKLKTRPDFWKPSTKDRTGIVTDLKTDRETEKEKHFRKIRDLNYPIQAVLQIMGLSHAKLIDEGARFFWIVACKNSPYNTEVYEFDSTDIEAFKEALKYKLEQIKLAIDKGIFLSYEYERDMGIKTVEFPFYYKKQMGIHDQIDINN